jgi:endonuclease VIII
MSEGPEVHRISAELNEEFAGSCIVAIESRLKKARSWLDEHPGLVEGKEVLGVQAAGKNIVWTLEDDIFFQMHLLMFGKIRTYSLKYRYEPDRTFRARIVSTSRQAVLFNVQVFNIGVGNPFEELPTLREMGPDICSVHFDKQFFLERLTMPENMDREIGPVLLDQRVAAGLGNYLKSDILFECRVNPWTLVGDLSPGDRACLADTIPEVAQRALRNRGQTVTDEFMEDLRRDPATANPSWSQRHWVFRHTNRPCRVCGTPIRQRRQGPGEGRITFFCPNCQRVSA